VLSIIEAAGWPIWFIILTSIIALAIIGERFWSLRTSLVAPRDVLPTTIREYQAKGVTPDLIGNLQQGPLIGRIFAAALLNERSSREVLKDAVEDAGRAVSIELERFLVSTEAVFRCADGVIHWRTHVFSARTGEEELRPIDTHEISAARWGTTAELGGPLRARLLGTGRALWRYRVELHDAALLSLTDTSAL